MTRPAAQSVPVGGGSAAPYDVAVVGAGVVGAGIAHELAKYRLSVALIEAGPDVGAGTSKASTAILHTGYDATPGTLEARMVRRGWELWNEIGPGLGVPIEPTGAILVAWNETEVAALDAIVEKSHKGGYDAVYRIPADELYRREPHLGPGALEGLVVPGEGIMCTFTAPLALATEAVENGVALHLDSPVVGLRPGAEGAQILEIADGRTIGTRWVVNAAGLGSDKIDRLFGHDRFTIIPRRGELIVFDKLSRRLLSHVILPVPTKMGKGVLVSPTVFGNVLLGPTAEDLEDRTATGSSAAGVNGLLEKGRRIMPELLAEEVTAVYAGLRAATEHSEYQLFLHADQQYVCVGGIRSTGLTAAPAIGEHLAGLLGEAGLVLTPRDDFRRIRMPNIGEAFTRPFSDADAIARDAEYGRIVCHCERVTRGEIRDALRSPIPARSLDALRRRTRTRMGRCQGFFCGAEVDELLAAAGDAPKAVVR